MAESSEEEDTDDDVLEFNPTSTCWTTNPQFERWIVIEGVKPESSEGNSCNTLSLVQKQKTTKLELTMTKILENMEAV